jgi:hypothetical protein
MTKPKTMKLTLPGRTGYVPSVNGNDLVRDGGKTDDRQDVTVGSWIAYMS